MLIYPNSQLVWDTNTASTGFAFDLDASVFVKSERTKNLFLMSISFSTTIYNRQMVLSHTRDNLDGEGDGDD